MAGAPVGSDVGDKLVATHLALEAGAIGHAFGGAIALAYAVAEPRATIDIDINVSVRVDDAQRVLDALPEEVMSRPDVLSVIRRRGQDRLRWGDVPLDLFFPQHRFHDVVAARATLEPFRDIRIPVITPTDLTVFKALFDRPKDWPDIESMLREGTVDPAEALHWVADILGDGHPSHVRLRALVAEVRRRPPVEVDRDVWRRLPGR